jgi:hypothetical protein
MLTVGLVRVSHEKRKTRTAVRLPVSRERRQEKRKEKRGKGVAAITGGQKAQIEDSTKQYLFLYKLLEILLIKDDCIVASGLDRACWTLAAAAALQDKYDDP